MSIITINMSLSVFLIFLLPLLNQEFFLKNLNGRLLAICCIAVMIRALIPVEFPFSATILVTGILPSIRDAMKYPVTIGNFSVKISALLLFLWIAAAIILIAKKFFLYFRLTKSIRRLPECQDSVVLEVLQSLYKKYPSARNIKVVKANLKISPLAAGLKSPVILLPEYQFDRSQYRMILEHELLHCTRHDTLIKFIADILCSVYWWNPFFYLLRSRIFELIELGNDRQMTQFFSFDEKAAYMQCLVDTVKKIHTCPVPFTLSFNTCRGKDLQRRLRLIADFRTSRRITELFVLGANLLLLWGVTCFTMEPYALPEKENCIRFDKDNCYFVQNGDIYEIYYQNEFYFSIDSIEYFNSDIPVYQKGEIRDD